MMEAMYHGVRCGVIHPGYTDADGPQAGRGLDSRKGSALYAIGPADPPEEIADAICFMIANSAVSGELWADAGWRPAA